MIIYLIVIVLILGFFIFAYVRAGSTYTPIIEEYKEQYRLAFMAAPFLYLLDQLRLIERFHIISALILRKMISLYGPNVALQNTRMFLAQLLSTAVLALLGDLIFTVIGDGDTAILFFGLILTILLPLVMYKRLEKEEKERNDSIIRELPEFVNKLILLINAGETVQQAIRHCVRARKNIERSPLYKELLKVVNKLSSNQPFHLVMDEFSKRTSIQEVSLFTTTVLLNYRKGGDDLVIALREISHDLWEKRKMLSKIKGEEASSKLVFPMVLIFIAVLLIIGYPAISMM